MFRAHLLLVFLLCEDGIDRNSADGNLLSGYAERFQICSCLVERDEVMLVMMDQPHRVHVEVSNDDHLTTRESLFGFQPRNDLSRKEMRANDQIGSILAQEFDERTRVELI